MKYQRDVSAAAISEWENELMEDPKVQQDTMHCPLQTLTSIEPPSPCSSQLQPSQRRALFAISHNLRHPKLQHQDPLRGLTYYQPSLVRTLLAFRFDKRIPYCNNEEIQAL